MSQQYQRMPAPGGNGASVASVRRAPAPIVGSYATTQTTSNGTDTGVNTMTKHVLPAGVGVEAVRLRFTNSAAGSNGDLDNGNAITVKCSVGLSTTGPWFPVSVHGLRTWTMDPGVDVETDSLPIHIPAAGTFYTKTFLSVTSGQVWTAQIPWGVVGTNFWASQSAGETDLSTSTAAFTTTTATRAYQPVSILAEYAPTTRPSVAIVGDSIAGGIGDTGTNNNRGFALIALNGVLPYTRIAVSGTKLFNIIDPNVGRRRLALIRGCNVALDEYGTNDIFTSVRTLAQLQADKITLWTILANAGMKTFTTTLTPQTTSTDSWATLANQTVRTGETVRTGLNDWIRDGAPVTSAANLTAVAVGTVGALRAGSTGHPLTGYFEVADTVESARNSGLWAVTGVANAPTVDGTHPSPAYHILMAAAITPATFTAAVAAA